MTSVPPRVGDRIRLTAESANRVVRVVPAGAEGIVKSIGDHGFIVAFEPPPDGVQFPFDPYYQAVGDMFGDAWIVVTPGGDAEHTTHNEWPDEGPTEGEPF